MKLNRILSSIISLSMILSLAACGNTETITNQTPNTSNIGDTTMETPEETDNKEPDNKNTEITPTEVSESFLNFVKSYKEYPKMLEMPDMGDTKYLGSDGSFDWESYSKDSDAYYDCLYSIRPDSSSNSYPETLQKFMRESALKFTNTDNNSANEVYSPVNIYMTLAMLAEVTDNNSQKQILEVLGIESLEQLRADATLIWESNYIDNGKSTLDFANSLWINNTIEDSLNQETLDNVANNYYASTFSGTAGDPSYNQAIQDWLNYHTNNLLKEQAGGVEFSPDLVIALASTIYLKDSWTDEFSEEATYENTFYISNDKEIKTEFMRQSDITTYYYGDNFGAISKSMNSVGSMLLILPDDGKTPSDVLNSDDFWDFVNSRYNYCNTKTLRVNLEIPKFDISSKLDIVGGLKELGITDVFNGATSDFTPLTGEIDNIAVTSATHAARVKIDEEGCEAAAFTVMMTEATSAIDLPQEEIDFILNRPFIFVITGEDDLPLFIGTVNTPVEGLDL